ncbi:MAG TPA: heat-stable protein [Methylomirabilota bacterium]|jgi:hypothetical protein
MAEQRVRRILCAAAPRGSRKAVTQLLDAAERHGAHALALLGDLAGPLYKPEDLRTVLRALANGGRHAFWVPGPGDAPVEHYLRESHEAELLVPFLRGVHGTTAFAPGYVLFAGMGGEISDDAFEPREEIKALRYPHWEVDYRLKALRDLDEFELVLMFWTPPADPDRGPGGSEGLAEFVEAHRPRLVVCHGDPEEKMLNHTLVVRPGDLKHGQYAIVNLTTLWTSFEEFAKAAR